MTDEKERQVGEGILLSFPLMHQILHAVFAGEQEHLTKTQFNILIILHFFGEHTMMQLSDLNGISKEQTTRAVAPLADAGLVERYNSLTNRSRVYVRLTESGRDRVRELIGRCREYMRGLAERKLSPDERGELARHLSVMIPILTRIMGE